MIGAGIAGASVAWRFANLGWQVRVLDAAEPGAGGSGNAAAILYPKLVSAELTPEHVQSMAFLRAREVLADPRLSSHFEATGVLWLQTRRHAASITPEHPWWQREVWPLTAAEASERAGITLHLPALWLPNAGVIGPDGLLSALLSHPRIELLCHHEVIRITPVGSSWQLLTSTRDDTNGVRDERTLTAGTLVVAAAGAGASLLQANYLPLNPVRGQVSLLPAALPLKTTLCYGGYLTPARQGCHVLGATFQPGRDDCTPTQADQLINRNSLLEVLPGLEDALGKPEDAAFWKARASLRWQTPDYLPLAGWMPWPPAHEALLRERSSSRPMPEAVHTLPKLGVTLGHGAKGFSQAWLAADILSRSLPEAEVTMADAVVQRLQPERFLIRAWKRGQLRTVQP